MTIEITNEELKFQKACDHNGFIYEDYNALIEIKNNKGETKSFYIYGFRFMGQHKTEYVLLRDLAGEHYFCSREVALWALADKCNKFDRENGI